MQEIQERPYGATGEAAVQSGVSRVSVSVYLIALRPHYSFSTSELMR